MASGGMAADRETVERQIETMLVQLEKGAYSKKANWAARIQGGVEQLLWAMNGAGGGGAGEFGVRMDRAIQRVMMDAPVAPGMQGELADVLADRPENRPPTAPTAAPDAPPGATPPENPQRQ